MEEDEFSDHESVKVRIIGDIIVYVTLCSSMWDNSFVAVVFLQGQIDDHGVFKTLAKLWQHNAHLAVFMNFVMSNCDPASLVISLWWIVGFFFFHKSIEILFSWLAQFFHLITDLYKEGTAKDMKKWAYEIHSTYLVPNAVWFPFHGFNSLMFNHWLWSFSFLPVLQPLKLNNVDEHVLHEIDDALQVDIDKEEILRKVCLELLMIEIL